MRFDRALATAAALMLSAPGLTGASGHVVWIELCDAAHPGRRVPLPIDGEHGPKACHANCGTLPDRRFSARGRPR